MAYSKRNNIFHTILFSRGMALAVLFLVVFVGFGVVSIAEKSIDASRDRKLSESQQAALLKKQDDMSRKLAALNSEDGKEAALRDQFPVVKEGEHVVVITDAVMASASGVPSLEEGSTKGGFWKFLKVLFSKK